MVLLYFAAGVNHFIHPAPYIKIIPPWLPYPQEVVVISGICEIICAILILLPATRVFGSWCLIALLIAVFPANIQMSINYYKENNPAFWGTILRLPLQAVLIFWAYKFTKPLS
jgi:uncharacterized membrane protein